MPKTDPDPQKRSLPAWIFQKHFEITYKVLLITLIPLALFAGGGHLVDKYLHTNPVGMVIGLLIAFPLAQYMVYKTFTSNTKK